MNHTITYTPSHQLNIRKDLFIQIADRIKECDNSVYSFDNLYLYFPEIKQSLNMYLRIISDNKAMFVIFNLKGKEFRSLHTTNSNDLFNYLCNILAQISGCSRCKEIDYNNMMYDDKEKGEYSKLCHNCVGASLFSYPKSAEECAICKENIHSDFFSSVCNHFFHKTCISKVISKMVNNQEIIECPLCRANINIDDI